MTVIGKGWDVPPEDDCISDFRWWRVRPGKALRVVVLSHEPLSFIGHYWGNRMVPCEAPDCKLCAKGVGRQRRFVFGCAEIYTEQIGLLEIGRSVALELRALTEAEGKFRGLVLEWTKATKSPQSRMEVCRLDLKPSSKWGLMHPPDLAKCLKLTWERGGKASQELLDEVPESFPGGLEEAIDRMKRRALETEPE